MLDGRMDGQMDGRMDGWMDGWIGGLMGRWTDGSVSGKGPFKMKKLPTQRKSKVKEQSTTLAGNAR
jgi:hypothetical protein